MSGNPRMVFDLLLARYGPQHWWPGDSPLEIMIGAVLVQNTNWRNAERAIANLREAGMLDPERLLAAHDEELEELLKPAGYFRVKSRRLRNLLRHLVDRHDGSIERMFEHSTDALREELLAINGIGPETADSILLYAGGKPTFVVDAYTARVLARHGWIDADAGYHDIQAEFLVSLPRDVAMYNEYHALLVRVGKEHCGKTAKCAGCPLESLLPEGGPREFSDG